ARSAPSIEHPGLSESLVTLARALDHRNDDVADAPSYLDLAVVVTGLEAQLDDLARYLMHLARRHEQTSWQEIGDALGVTRQTAYKRWGPPSPNDPDADDDA
ncbi:MAG: hypothetical protein ACRDYF_15925, partial [Acidimicrobiia bacterium]